ncbi:IAA-amino acid hydrolase ILR1-like 6 [Sergentomyia squamirostris]
MGNGHSEQHTSCRDGWHGVVLPPPLKRRVALTRSGPQINERKTEKEEKVCLGKGREFVVLNSGGESTAQYAVFLHTSASLALNESWDPDVRDDMEMMLNKIVPEGLPYRHSCEGPDDMPAHVKACFLGSSLTIPITDGKLSLGTWQGVWLCEHRDHAGSRKLVITLSGCPRDSARSPLSPVSPIASTSS